MLVQSPLKDKVLPLVWSICWQPPLWCVGCPEVVHVHLVAVCEHLNDGVIVSVYSTRVSPAALTKHLGAFGHTAVLHVPQAEPGQLAPPWAGAGLVHVRDCEPLPQNWLQGPKADQPPSIGHGPPPQARLCLLAGHAAPPCLGAVRLRVRCWEPPPQDLVHVVYAPKFGTTQSTGHERVLQFCERDTSVGQALPPHELARAMVRVALWVPVPQDLEQADQPVQAFMTQWRTAPQ